MDAIRGCLGGHAAAAPQPGHRRPAFGQRAAIGMKAVDAPDPLSLEPIDGQADLDDVGTQLGGRDAVDQLADERIDVITHALSRIRRDERFHADILPNICSPPYGPNTDNLSPRHVIDIKGNNSADKSLRLSKASGNRRYNARSQASRPFGVSHDANGDDPSAPMADRTEHSWDCRTHSVSPCR